MDSLSASFSRYGRGISSLYNASPCIARELGARLGGVPDRGAGLIEEAARERGHTVDIGEVAGEADRYAHCAGAFAVADAADQRGKLVE